MNQDHTGLCCEYILEGDDDEKMNTYVEVLHYLFINEENSHGLLSPRMDGNIKQRLSHLPHKANGCKRDGRRKDKFKFCLRLIILISYFGRKMTE